jgi:hypothetical protein
MQALSLVAANTQEPFKPFYNRPGMTSAFLPIVLAENRLRGLRGSWLNNNGNNEVDATPTAIKALLMEGPLYLGLQRNQHVVVLVGIKRRQAHCQRSPCR